VDWAIAENGRAGSPYAGRLDTGKIAYMGHACGARQAMAASSDPRTTTTVVLNAVMGFTLDASEVHKAPIALFEGGQDDDDVLAAADADLPGRRPRTGPMYKAALEGMSHDGAYPGPDPRWSRAVLAWLDWQPEGDGKAATTLGGLLHDGWRRIGANRTTAIHAPEFVVAQQQAHRGAVDQNFFETPMMNIRPRVKPLA
jgi:hypothetical protein